MQNRDMLDAEKCNMEKETMYVPGTDLAVSRRELFELMRNQRATREMLTDHVLISLKLDAAPQHVQEYVRLVVSRFFSRCMGRWRHCKCVRDRFLRANSGWLNVEIKASELVADADQRLASRLQAHPMDSKKDSPPPKPARVEPEWPKRMRGVSGHSLRPMPEIPPEIPPERTRPKYTKRNAPVSYTPEEVLDNIIVKAKLTRWQYEIVRDYALGINCFIYPSFAAIQKVMMERAAAGMPLPQIEPDPTACDGMMKPDYMY